MFEIKDACVYKTTVTPGGGIITECHGAEKMVMLTIDRESIPSDGITPATITVQWQKFNLETKQYEPDPTNIDSVTFNTPRGKITDPDGIIEFTSLEPGEYEFSALYGLNTVKVVVTGA